MLKSSLATSVVSWLHITEVSGTCGPKILVYYSTICFERMRKIWKTIRYDSKILIFRDLLVSSMHVCMYVYVYIFIHIHTRKYYVFIWKEAVVNYFNWGIIQRFY
jgi:hypothetical protein